jgi:hypothetical protein
MLQTSRIPNIAIVLNGGDVLSVIVQEWPDSIPMPLAAIVDFDIQGVAEEDLTHILIDEIPFVAVCRFEVPNAYGNVKIGQSPMPQTSKIPSIAIVLSGGDVLSIIVQDWPDSIPMLLAAIVDFDTQGVAEEDLTHILIDEIPFVAVCRFEVPELYEEVKIEPSPKAILAKFGQFADSGD